MKHFRSALLKVKSLKVKTKKLQCKLLRKYLLTFDIQDPNQLIRASALRVLSSIRDPMIVPIMMLAIKESVMDMSPYVRKTAAHAIPKLYRY